MAQENGQLGEDPVLAGEVENPPPAVAPVAAGANAQNGANLPPVPSMTAVRSDPFFTGEARRPPNHTAAAPDGTLISCAYLDAKDFLARIERLRSTTYNNDPRYDEQAISRFTDNFRGQAESWWRIKRASPVKNKAILTTWTGFRAAFKKHWFPVTSRFKHSFGYITLQHTPGEACAHFLQRIADSYQVYHEVVIDEAEEIVRKLELENPPRTQHWLNALQPDQAVACEAEIQQIRIDAVLAYLEVNRDFEVARALAWNCKDKKVQERVKKKLMVEKVIPNAEELHGLVTATQHFTAPVQPLQLAQVAGVETLTSTGPTTEDLTPADEAARDGMEDLAVHRLSIRGGRGRGVGRGRGRPTQHAGAGPSAAARASASSGYSSTGYSSSASASGNAAGAGQNPGARRWGPPKCFLCSKPHRASECPDIDKLRQLAKINATNVSPSDPYEADVEADFPCFEEEVSENFEEV